MDIETLQNKIQAVGGLVGEDIKIRNAWDEGLQQLQISGYVLNEMTWQQNEGIEKEIENLMKEQQGVNKYTHCLFKEMIRQLLRAESERKILSFHANTWERLLEINKRDKLLNLTINPQKRYTSCNSKGCNVTGEIVSMTRKEIWCQFQVMPQLFGQNFWYPEFKGDWVDEKNMTHHQRGCARWPFGMVCPYQTAIYEPCSLQHSIGVCKWELKPTNDTEITEIGQNEICVTGNKPVYLDGILYKPPINKCVRRVYTLYDPEIKRTYTFGQWQNVENYLSMHKIEPLPPFAQEENIGNCVDLKNKKINKEGIVEERIYESMAYGKGKG
uniref:uncharacterized protein n=1 Tax=Pristiophorus japonicus TaxID=55135 RepID=UPI00398F23F9